MKCPSALVLSITTAAIAIAQNLTDDELALLACAATQFGDTLDTLSTQRSIDAKSETA